MTKQLSSLGLCASVCAMVAFSLIPLTEAEAQRRGGGGRAGASMSRPSSGSFNRSSGASSRQVRSSASSSLNYGGSKANTANRGGSQWASTSTRPTTGAINSGNRTNVNTGNINTGDRNTNISGNNINTGDVNINRGDVDIDVDGGYGCCYGDWDYHPVAAGVAVGTAVAVTRAWTLGAYYSTLPTTCVVVYRGSVTYYQCGTYWYQPVYSGMTVQYVAVATPK